MGTSKSGTDGRMAATPPVTAGPRRQLVDEAAQARLEQEWLEPFSGVVAEAPPGLRIGVVVVAVATMAVAVEAQTPLLTEGGGGGLSSWSSGCAPNMMGGDPTTGSGSVTITQKPGCGGGPFINDFPYSGYNHASDLHLSRPSRTSS